MNPNDIFEPSSFSQDLEMAVQGEEAAAIRVGYGFLTGYEGQVDFNQARAWFRRPAAPSVAGVVWLAYVDLADPATRGDPVVAADALQRLAAAASAGDPIGQTLLGRCRERGVGVLSPDVSAAGALYASAASQFALAQTYLAEMSIRDQRYSAALAALQPIPTVGELRGTVDLGDLYARRRGPGLTYFALAKGLLRSAAQRGNVRGLFRLGLLYLGGVGGNPPNPSRAFNVFTRCAGLGYPPAQAKLGLCYANGVGVATDLQKARSWLRKASRYLPSASEALRALPGN